MPGQRETRIEDYAFNYLGSYYAKRPKNSELLISKLELTKKGAQVDGLFAYKNEDNSYFVASLSTRQSARLSALLINYKRNGLSNYRFLTAITLLTGPALLGYVMQHWVVLWVLPFLSMTIGFALHSRLEKGYLKQQIVAAVDELKNCPADEQWLCITASSLCWRNNFLADKLAEVCHRRSIGLITVGKRTRITLRLEPRATSCRRTDFLAYYAAEESIRKNLTDRYMRVA